MTGEDGAAPTLDHLANIFHDALALPKEAWDEFLEYRCAGNDTLKTEVRALLQASEEEALLGATRAAAARAAARNVGHGRMIGPYRLERLLGRGGMGAVYLAHRADGEFNHQVAIKLIDLPLATDLFRERFKAERQILASLAHPFIARLLDGGVSEFGELYLVMEYVDGSTITRYCQDHALTLRECLALFVEVCSAVQFAHQSLVVHRDLKPDNILIASDGTPRLLDFGTAKLLVPASLDAAVGGFTQHGILSFTPQYASPEQVLGEPITTASDTYSLGVLLYLLLAGRPPYEIREFTTSEMLRVICSEQPLKPSAAPAGPEFRGLRLDADLDAIVLKALRKEAHQRYLTVSELSADIQAYLGGRPVGAQRGTLRYRAAKFVKRNRLILLVVSVLLLSWAVGSVAVAWQAHVASLQRQRAEARSEDLRQLSNSLLSEIDEAIKELPGSTSAQRLLVERVMDHLDRMSKDAPRDSAAQLDLVDAYTRLGNIQGNPYDQNIGDPNGALSSIEKAIRIAAGLRAAEPREANVLRAFALAEQSRGEVLFGMSRTQESVTAMRTAKEAFEARLTIASPTATEYAEAASAVGQLADQLGAAGVPSLGDSEGAREAYRRSLDLSREALQKDPTLTRSLRTIAITYQKLGALLSSTDPSEAVRQYQLSLDAWGAVEAADPSTHAANRRIIANVHRKIGNALAEARDYTAAIQEFETQRDVYEGYVTADPVDTRAAFDLHTLLSDEGLTYVDMSNAALSAQGPDRLMNQAKALDLLQRSMAIEQRLLLTNSNNLSWQVNLASEKVVAGGLLQSLGHDHEGVDLAAAGMRTLRDCAQAPDASIEALSLAASATLTVSPSRPMDTHWAVTTANRLVALTHRKNPDYLLSLSRAYRLDGQPQEATSAAREGLALLPPTTPGARQPRLQTLLALAALPAVSKGLSVQ